MRSQQVKLCLSLIAVLFLSACVSVSQVTPTDSLNQTWESRATYLYKQALWTAHMSLLGEAKQQKFKTRVVWKQQADNYQIKLKDFLGRTIAVIDGAPGLVIAKTSKGERFEGTDAETLIDELFGIRIPVTGLRYWLQGLPLPDRNVEKLILTDYGVAEAIGQQGWLMSYPHYLDNAPFKMPSQVELAYHDVQLKVKISKWTFPP